MKFLSFILSLFIITSCQNNERSVESIKIDVNNRSKKSYYQIAKNPQYIPLQTDSNCILYSVDKLCIKGNKIIILDRSMSSVYIFDKSGRFISKLSELGHKKGKYMRIDDFESNNDGTVIQILDGMRNKLITYANGKFKSEAVLPFSAYSFVTNNDKIYFHRNMGPYKPELMYQLIETDKQFNIKNRYLKIEKPIDVVFSPRNPLQSGEGKISFLPIYRKTIFNINSKGVFEKYLLNFGENWIEDDFIHSRKNPNTFISELSQSNYVYFVNAIEGDKHLAISFKHKNKSFSAVYDKASKKLVFIDDMYSTYCDDIGFHAYYDNSFVSIIKAEQLLKSYKSGRIAKEPNIDKIFGSIKKNDNPIIMMSSFNL